MLISASTDHRELPRISIDVDFVVAGGGLSGVCAAIAAAREGLKVALVQDRPVLGGNASSEVRLWALGATSHLGNNNRWAREGGVMGEILELNLYRNRQGNPVIFDMVLLDLVSRESNIQLFLNTAIQSVESNDGHIRALCGFNSINETRYRFSAPRFCDATGDGIVGFLAGAAFRVGSEERQEFDEGMAPHEHFGHLLGHSIYFYTRHTSEPVEFVPPSFALMDITEIPRYKRLTSALNGCDLWWLEWGGRLDTVHDSEQIKWELWRIVWGVWNYIKNSGEFADAANLTLDWVGLIPGKRESRRFIGDYILQQKDIIEQRDAYDAVSFGGWSIDLHPADGVYSKLDACLQFHSKGIYTIPFRSLYSRDIDNLFIAGRIISVSHVALGSTRVMCTCGQNGHVIGQAAALCAVRDWTPRQLSEPGHIAQLQDRLMENGSYIPRRRLTLLPKATVRASSVRRLSELSANGRYQALEESCALMLPLRAGERLPIMTITLATDEACILPVTLLTSEKAFNHTPEITLGEQMLNCRPGVSSYTLQFDYCAGEDRYLFLTLARNPSVRFALSDDFTVAIKTLWHRVNNKVAKNSRQIANGDYGVEEFDFWLPQRRPMQQIPAVIFDPPLRAYSAEAVIDGAMRPSDHTHAWVPDRNDPAPELTLSLAEPIVMGEIGLMFDNDFDHAMETAQWGHHERVSPHCVKSYSLWADGRLIAEVEDNCQSWRKHIVASDRPVRQVVLRIRATHGGVAGVFAIHCIPRRQTSQAED
ncbi:FAD-dependent oxidoreductase [Martelella alba]|uniref:FAD-dependent oxidoreductase n=1 Tax=Martelella alba TaxID=2590451 RepID=A0ABY2SDF6_9HYPH|nr:FAD-dependent oxidoreductase [Martelella alba]TKI02480.1 FAD-dependent oxidoreductase [Martelella alba]